jgi:hypothetical protein
VYVDLKIYNILGKEVAAIVNQSSHREHMSTSGMRQLFQGVYFYKLKVADFEQTKTCIKQVTNLDYTG